MGKRRIDTADTIDQALHLIRQYQVEGWGAESVKSHIDYGSVKSGGRRLPVGATVTVRLIPGREP